MLSFTANTELLQRFQNTLTKYIAGSSRTVDEILEAKGRDLGIKLFRGFRARQWGGSGLVKNLALAEQAARRASGRGTRVRGRLLAEYESRRAAANYALRSIGQKRRRFGGTADQAFSLIRARDAVRKARSNLWRLFVKRELNLRQRGIGALAASFLWFRSRKNNQVGRYYVRNRYARRPPLGYVEKQPGLLRIVGQTEGLSIVDSRYGIVSRALASVEIEMRELMLKRTLNAIGGAA